MNILKETFFRLAAKPPLPRDRAAILMYHSVSAGVDYFMNVEPRDFEQQMAYLAQQKRPVITLAELVRRLKQNEPLGGALALTFDDGYRDNYTVAFPVLQQYHFPATIFITTDMVGKVDKRGLSRLTEDDIRTMDASGRIEIAPHTKTHPKLATLSSGQAREEIEDSRQAIQAITGKRSGFFAYPYGNFNDSVVGIVRTSGFEAAVSVEEGTVGPKSDLLHLPRNSIDRSTTMTQFRGKISTAIDSYQRLKHMV